MQALITLTGKVPRTLHSDNGPEYASREFQAYANRVFMKLSKGTPYHANERGKVERYQRTLWEAVRATWIASGCPPSLWPWMLDYCVFTTNRCPRMSLNGRSPYEVMFERAPDLTMCKPFGCVAYHHLHSDSGEKFKKRAGMGVMLGIAPHMSDYTYIIGVQYPGNNRMYVKYTTDVTFDVTSMYFHVKKDAITTTDTDVAGPAPTPEDVETPVEDTVAPSDLPSSESEIPAITGVTLEPVDSDESGDATPDVVAAAFELNRELDSDPVDATAPLVDETAFAAYGDSLFSTLNESTSELPVRVPANLKELATYTPAEQQLWMEAIDTEWYDNMLTNVMDTELVAIAEVKARGYSILPTSIVLKAKPPQNNEPARLKARIVAGGHREKTDHIGNTFAPTVNALMVRAIFAIFNYLRAKYKGKKLVIVLRSGDVSNAFGHAKLPIEKEVYVQAPLKKYQKAGFCFKLKSAMYGLSESPFWWNNEFSKIIILAGFDQSELDSSVFYKMENGELVGLIIVFVDDILFTGREDIWTAAMEVINKHVPMRDQGEPTKYLGMNIRRDSSGIYITHEDYIKSMLERFDFGAAFHSTKIPMDPNRRLKKVPVDVELDVKRYQQMVGSLIHTSVYARPDVAYAVGEVSKHLVAHGDEHVAAVKKIFRYLKGTVNRGLFAKEGGNFVMEVYTDSDWASDTDTRLSKTGMVVTIDGMVVGYYSKDQKSVSLSSCEAELYALSQAIRLVIYLRNLFIELGLMTKDHCVTIKCDSISAIEIVKSEGSFVPAKHIDIRLKYIKQAIKQRKIEVVYVNTTENLADGFTKPLGLELYSRLFAKLMVDAPPKK